MRLLNLLEEVAEVKAVTNCGDRTHYDRRSDQLLLTQQSVHSLKQFTEDDWIMSGLFSLGRRRGKKSKITKIGTKNKNKKSVTFW